MLTRQQRTRKHFSQLCPFGKPLKISILASKCQPNAHRSQEVQGWRQGQVFSEVGWGQPGQSPQGPKETRCFHLLPKLHDRRGGVLQGHVAVVGCVQFLELHAVLCSEKQDKKHKKINLCEGWSLAQHSELMVQPGGFYSATPGKHASQSTVGKINHGQTVKEGGLAWFQPEKKFWG